jgi:hypothetical protein
LAQQREKIDRQEPGKFDLLVGEDNFFVVVVVPCQFPLHSDEWPENQILIPD